MDVQSTSIGEAVPSRLVSTMADNEQFAPLLAQYVRSSLPKVIEAIEAYLAGDAEASGAEAVHKVAGTATGYGFAIISEAALISNALFKLGADAEKLAAPTRHLLALLKVAVASFDA